MKLIFILATMSLLLGCSTKHLINHTAQQQRISVGSGPEDMDIVTIDNVSYLLVSCLERRKPGKEGDFWLLNLDTKETKRVERRNEPIGLVFRPHGLSILMKEDGLFDVYVVHHGIQGNGNKSSTIYGHSILQYSWDGQYLNYENVYDNDLLVNPNDITVLQDRSFYVSNSYRDLPSGLFQVLGISEKSTVVYYNKGIWTKVADHIEYGNGIHFLEKSNQLLVTSSIGQKMWSYLRKKDGTLHKPDIIVENLGVLDNISHYNESTVLVTSYATNKYLLHSISPKINCPTTVWRVNWKKKTVDPLYRNSGGKESINCGSTAVLHEGQLYIGQVFEPYVQSIDLRHRDLSTTYDIEE